MHVGITGSVVDSIKQANEKIKSGFKDAFTKGGQAATRFLIQTLLSDVFTFIKTGDKGQTAIFNEKGWDEYYKDLGSNVVGTLLDQLSGEDGLLKLNLCQLDPRIALKLSVSLREISKPSKPKCSVRDLKKSFADTQDRLKGLKDEDIFKNINEQFIDSSGSDLGTAFALHVKVNEQIIEEKDAKTFTAWE